MVYPTVHGTCRAPITKQTRPHHEDAGGFGGAWVRAAVGSPARRATQGGAGFVSPLS
jgi:hypothetical protein